jgi:hypothetical protein
VSGCPADVAEIAVCWAEPFEQEDRVVRRHRGFHQVGQAELDESSLSTAGVGAVVDADDLDAGVIGGGDERRREPRRRVIDDEHVDLGLECRSLVAHHDEVDVGDVVRDEPVQPRGPGARGEHDPDYGRSARSSAVLLR